MERSGEGLWFSVCWFVSSWTDVDTIPTGRVGLSFLFIRKTMRLSPSWIFDFLAKKETKRQAKIITYHPHRASPRPGILASQRTSFQWRAAPMVALKTFALNDFDYARIGIEIHCLRTERTSLDFIGNSNRNRSKWIHSLDLFVTFCVKTESK